MSYSSVEARLGNRSTGNLMLILLALLLAGLSINLAQSAEVQGRHSHAGPAAALQAGPAGKQQVVATQRHLFLPDAAPHQARRYHPGFETSDSAGALGFWILVSLCGALLLAAAAPRLLERLRKA